MLPTAAPSSETYKIVRFTNKTNFDFTAEMGARYGGVPYFVPAGKSLLMPKPVAMHLAKHLAQQFFLHGAPGRTEAEIDGKGSTRPLFDQDKINVHKMTYITDEYEEVQAAPKSEAELLKEKIDALNSTFSDVGPSTSTGMPTVSASGDIKQPVSNPVTIEYKDKADVVNALKSKGIPYDARKSKDFLEKLLNESK